MAVDIEAVLTASIEDFKAKMAEARGEMDLTNTSGSSAFSKLSSIGKGALLGIAAAGAVVIGASVDLAEKFQGTVSSIAASGDISIGAAQKIGNAFLATAGTTIYSGQQIGQAFSQVAGQVKALNGGVLNAKAAMDVMRPSMDLAEASGTSLANATSDLTNTLQAFGLKITASPLVSNVLFNAARVTGQSVDTLSSALDKARARMGTAAPSVQQLGGLLVDLTSHGETGRAAMTALGSAFTGILAPTAAVTAAQQAAGVSFTNAKGQLDPLNQILATAKDSIAGMGNAQAVAQLKAEGFGSASQKVLGVVEAGPAVLDKYAASVAKAGSAHAAAQKQSQTLQHQVETLKAQFEDYATILGEKLIPILEKVASAVAKVIEWFTKHKGVAEAVGIAIAALVAGPIAAYIASMITAAAASIAAAAPMLAIVAAALLVAAAVYEIVKHWSTIEAFFKGLWKDVKKIFDDAFGFIKSHLQDFVEAAVVILTGGIGLLPVLIYRYWSQIQSGVVTAWNDIVSFFTGIPGKIVAALSSLGGLLLSWIQDAWQDQLNWLQDAINVFIGFWSTVPNKIVNAITSFGGLLLSWIQTAWNTFYAWVEGAWANEIAFWESIPGRIISALAGLGGDLLTLGGQAMGSLANGVEAAWGAISGWFANLPGNIVSAIGGVTDLLYNIGVAIIDSLKRGLEDAFNAVKSFVSGIAGDIASLKGPISYDATLLVPHGNAIMQGLAQGLEQGFTSKVAPYMSGVAGAIAGGLGGGTSAGGGISPLAGLGGSATGTGAAAGTQPIYLQIDGNTFATVILPSLQAVGALKQRTLPLPVFGTANA